MRWIFLLLMALPSFVQAEVKADLFCSVQAPAERRLNVEVKRVVVSAEMFNTSPAVYTREMELANESAFDSGTGDFIVVQEAQFAPSITTLNPHPQPQPPPPDKQPHPVQAPDKYPHQAPQAPTVCAACGAGMTYTNYQDVYGGYNGPGARVFGGAKRFGARITHPFGGRGVPGFRRFRGRGGC